VAVQQKNCTAVGMVTSMLAAVNMLVPSRGRPVAYM
jgi:hypothetical protein